MDFGEKRGSIWGNMLDIVKKDYSDERIKNQLTSLKAEKIIIDSINSSKYKD